LIRLHDDVGRRLRDWINHEHPAAAFNAALAPRPGPRALTAELWTGSIPPPPYPDAAANQPGVLEVGAAGRRDRLIDLLLLPVGARAGLAGAGGCRHHGGGAVAPEGHVTLGNTFG